MNRDIYFSVIEERLTTLSVRVRRNSSLNLQNLNIHCENFYAQLFNLIFGYNFRNLNEDNQNIESVDLIDETNHILAQVSESQPLASSMMCFSLELPGIAILPACKCAVCYAHLLYKRQVSIFYGQ